MGGFPESFSHSVHNVLPVLFPEDPVANPSREEHSTYSEVIVDQNPRHLFLRLLYNADSHPDGEAHLNPHEWGIESPILSRHLLVRKFLSQDIF